MARVARAELLIERPVGELWALIADFGAWERFMPTGFRPLQGPERPLRVGDRMRVRVAPFATLGLEVIRVEPEREICWRGGLPSLIVGEHAFLFEPLGPSRTRVRSEEPFSGVLAHIPGLADAIAHGAGAAGMSMLLALRDAR